MVSALSISGSCHTLIYVHVCRDLAASWTALAREKGKGAIWENNVLGTSSAGEVVEGSKQLEWRGRSDQMYWMIYRRLGFLAVLWFGSSPTPSPLSSRQLVAYLSQFSCMLPVELTDVRASPGRGGGGVAERPNDTTEKAWSSIYHSIHLEVDRVKEGEHWSLDIQWFNPNLASLVENTIITNGTQESGH